MTSTLNVTASAESACVNSWSSREPADGVTNLLALLAAAAVCFLAALGALAARAGAAAPPAAAATASFAAAAFAAAALAFPAFMFACELRSDDLCHARWEGAANAERTETALVRSTHVGQTQSSSASISCLVGSAVRPSCSARHGRHTHCTGMAQHVSR